MTAINEKNIFLPSGRSLERIRKDAKQLSKANKTLSYTEALDIVSKANGAEEGVEIYIKHYREESSFSEIASWVINSIELKCKNLEKLENLDMAMSYLKDGEIDKLKALIHVSSSPAFNSEKESLSSTVDQNKAIDKLNATKKAYLENGEVSDLRTLFCLLPDKNNSLVKLCKSNLSVKNAINHMGNSIACLAKNTVLSKEHKKFFFELVTLFPGIRDDVYKCLNPVSQYSEKELIDFLTGMIPKTKDTSNFFSRRALSLLNGITPALIEKRDLKICKLSISQIESHFDFHEILGIIDDENLSLRSREAAQSYINGLGQNLETLEDRNEAEKQHGFAVSYFSKGLSDYILFEGNPVLLSRDEARDIVASTPQKITMRIEDPDDTWNSIKNVTNKPRD